MNSLCASIAWDEARFGLSLDLERFMIVATSDFNMGAMENKGLNIFNNLLNIKTQLNNGRCVMLGIMVYSSFMTNTALRTGVIPIPNPRTERLLGGHAIALSGWNDDTKRFSFRNSWGTRVGNQGTFTIPYDYICNPNLSGDAWYVN
jgi:C1A family cysteine protease